MQVVITEKSNPTERRSTIESNLKMTNSCNQQFSPLSLSLSLVYLLNFLSFYPRHFTSYESRDLLLPATYVLIKLYKYAREKEIGIIYVHCNFSLVFFLLFSSPPFRFCRFLFDIDILFIIRVQMKETENERRKKRENS